MLNRLVTGILIYNFTFTLLVFILNMISTRILGSLPSWFVLLLGVINIGLTFTYIVGFFIYYNKVVNSNCACVNNNDRLGAMHKFLGVWRYILLVSAGLSALLLVLSLFVSLFKLIKTKA